MNWKADIIEWAKENDRDPAKVESICLRKGWDSKKYHFGMKNALHDWLTQWYTLSIKNLPEPATYNCKNYKRNPNSVYCRECGENSDVIKRLFDGPLLISCGDIIHDSNCYCEECQEEC